MVVFFISIMIIGLYDLRRIDNRPNLSWVIFRDKYKYLKSEKRHLRTNNEWIWGGDRILTARLYGNDSGAMLMANTMPYTNCY
ncbi:hypothetical protein HMPREF1553_02036 [Porphyromonas gingivalis F0568]|nr:hypothetical protein HMPREF1553_02036 [Porphyromonas gingivalis F0568]